MSRACAGCGGPLYAKAKGNTCRACNCKAMGEKGRAIASAVKRAKGRKLVATFLCEGGCGRTIADHPGRATRLCKRCFASTLGRSDAKREKCRAKMLAHFEDPEFRAVQLGRCADGLRHKLATDPAFRADYQERGRRCGSARLGINRPGAYGPGHEVRMRAGAKVSARKLAWCAPSYRQAHRDLQKRKLLTSAEARAVIIDQAASERAAYLSGAMQDLETFKRVRSALGWNWEGRANAANIEGDQERQENG